MLQNHCGRCNLCRARHLKIQTAALLNQCAALTLRRDPLFSDTIGGSLDNALGMLYAIHKFAPPKPKELS
jgi:hypothetical protein